MYYDECNGKSYTITYPNGVTYWETFTDTGSVSSWDGSDDTQRWSCGVAVII